MLVSGIDEFKRPLAANFTIDHQLDVVRSEIQRSGGDGLKGDLFLDRERLLVRIQFFDREYLYRVITTGFQKVHAQGDLELLPRFGFERTAPMQGITYRDSFADRYLAKRKDRV